MNQTGQGKGLGLLELARNLRDTGMDAWAKLALVVTSSNAYLKADSVAGKPALLAKALLRKPAEQAMAKLLAQLQMPSREEVLAISQRLTRIEVVLDDLGATLETVQKSAAATQRPAARERAGNGGPAAAAPTIAPSATSARPPIPKEH